MNNKIIFSIPIYAMSPDELNRKYNEKINALNREFPNMVDQRIIDYNTFPQRIWQYNHIVGYIEISAKLRDVYFNVYLPPKNKKYYWLSNQKVFLALEIPDNPHFIVFGDDSNDEIINKIYERIKEIQKCLPQRYYIDLMCFDNIVPYLDLRSLLFNVRRIQG